MRKQANRVKKELVVMLERSPTVEIRRNARRSNRNVCGCLNEIALSKGKSTPKKGNLRSRKDNASERVETNAKNKITEEVSKTTNDKGKNKHVIFNSPVKTRTKRVQNPSIKANKNVKSTTKESKLKPVSRAQTKRKSEDKTNKITPSVEETTNNNKSDLNAQKIPKRRQSKNNSKQTQKTLEVCTSVPKLRTRKVVKYEESSLDSSQLEESRDRKKVPIYNQPSKDKRPTKRKGDQYEFDSDSEKYKKRKKRTSSDSDEYNKTIENILKNVVKKTKIKKQGRIFNDEKPILKEKKINNNNVSKQAPQIVPLDKEMLVETVPTQNVINEPAEDLNFSDGDNDVDNFFGFTEKPKSQKKIQIISDVQLQPTKEWRLSIGSPTFLNGRPTANSTMLNNILTPWRFNDINIKRNPHFITLKNSSLPCISQEPVLDHSIVDKLESTLNSTHENLPRNATKTVKKVPLQKPITDYLNGNNENKENSQTTLFDCHQLSPIKSTRNLRDKLTPVKRRILGDKNDNFSSTPLRNLSPQKRANLTNFGFDSFDDLETTNEVVVKGRDDRPFRLSINVNDKKYKGKPKRVKIIESPEVSDEEKDTSDDESEVGEVKLFEDFADTQDHLQISDVVVNRRKKSKKYDADKTAHRHKKRKDVRSKEEEEQAEKWAAAFNSMCEEIEQFPLEVE